ncbi:MAG: CHAP domain-containing protein, partial [Pseudomonadota bacterium]|nr:CHAP domain-containing protein [Pseudomonadota bacterium]
RGVSLQALIGANPQIRNPHLIQPGQTLNIPAGGAAPGATPGATPPRGSTPTGNASGARTVQIAESFLNRNASELKRSGQLPMDPSVPSNLCCANFVSAVLRKNGLMTAREHTNAVRQLDITLRNKGWQPVNMANAKPGDVVIMQRGGVSHTEIVAKNENGRVTLIGSNNRNADGSQRITYDPGPWWHSKVSAILTPPR